MIYAGNIIVECVLSTSLVGGICLFCVFIFDSCDSFVIFIVFSSVS